MDLKQASTHDLVRIRRDVEAELRVRHQAKPEDTEHQLRDAAQKWGYALTEVLSGVIPDYEREAMHPRYQHPFDPNLVWSGAGRKPDWVREWEREGHSVEELRIGRQ